MAMMIPRTSRAWANISRQARAWLKRAASKQDRARAKIDPERAPNRRYYCGWFD